MTNALTRQHMPVPASATPITIAELGRRYATPAARERDGVTVVWRGIDQGTDEHGEPLPMHPDAKAPSGLDFGQARVDLRYEGMPVWTVEHGCGGWWVLTHDDALSVGADSVLVLSEK